jgi:formylmethanofuran dehydrogenase subunit C
MSGKKMKEILLAAKIKVKNPVDGSQITPNVFTVKRIDEIEELELSVGNKKKKLKLYYYQRRCTEHN